MNWTEHHAKWKDCTGCALCEQRDHIVLARGSVPCDVLFVGEAPGQSEDVLGQPFVGPAGKLLDDIIQRSVCNRIVDGHVFMVSHALTNLVACFPRDAKGRGDNEPEVDEIKACAARLREFVLMCQPKLVVCVGRLASEWVGRNETCAGIASVRKIVDIIHPAAILRMPLAQRAFAVRKCEVTIANALEEIYG